MKRFFNVSGPCLPEKHYMIPSQQRCKGIKQLIDQIFFRLFPEKKIPQI